MQLGPLIANYFAASFRAPGNGLGGWFSMRVMKQLNHDRSVDAICQGFGDGPTTTTTTTATSYSSASSLSNDSKNTGDVWLELGPGHGFATRHILKEHQPSKLYGVEISKVFRQGLQDTFANELQAGQFEIHANDAKDISFIPNNSVHNLFGMNVIYFLDPLSEYLAEMKRVMTPGGRMVFAVSDSVLDMNPEHFVNTDWELCRQQMQDSGFCDTAVSDTYLDGTKSAYRIISGRKK